MVEYRIYSEMAGIEVLERVLDNERDARDVLAELRTELGCAPGSRISVWMEETESDPVYSKVNL